MKVATSDGWTLDLSVREPSGDPVGAALLVPAMMVDRRSLEVPAQALVAAGWRVGLADFRGHGASGPLPARGGTWGYDELVRCDLPALARAVRALAGPGRVVWVGHSLGAHISVASLDAVPVSDWPDALVMAGGNVWQPRFEQRRHRRLVKGAVMRGFRRVSQRMGRFPSRMLRFGPAEEATAYVEDVARFWESDAWADRAGHPYGAAALGYDRPVLSLLGKGDRWLCAPDGGEAWARARLPRAALSLRVVSGEELGGGPDPGHMDLCTDRRMAGVWAEIAAWARSTPSSC